MGVAIELTFFKEEFADAKTRCFYVTRRSRTMHRGDGLSINQQEPSPGRRLPQLRAVEVGELRLARWKRNAPSGRGATPCHSSAKLSLCLCGLKNCNSIERPMNGFRELIKVKVAAAGIFFEQDAVIENFHIQCIHSCILMMSCLRIGTKDIGIKNVRMD
ncbi:hypothetical protein HG15A2_03240 [Adhaeretor mobilis]|uniref:Uncharacterized protein n=1 Tax=Adhaeretor mobilis TaxID=1930276 RepID=A0A517MQ99_9BACT|nr:hypothetical protein HG15A2_03240 [Adhaeretor mobilis]